MRKMNLKTNITKRISMCIALLLCLLIAGCSNSDSGERGFTDFEHIEAEYLETIANLNWPEGVTLPESLEGEDTRIFSSWLWRYKSFQSMGILLDERMAGHL